MNKVKGILSVIFLAFGILFAGTAGSVPEVNDQREETAPPHNFCCSEDFPDLFLTSPYLTGESVSEIQDVLLKLGYYQGALSGVYDEKTARAVKVFQNRCGLPADGTVKYHVWLKLAQEVENVFTAKALPAPPGEVSIVIDVFRLKLIVFSDGTPYAQFPVAVGKEKTPSPIGNWRIAQKDIAQRKEFGSRWMGLNVPWGRYGIHGTNRPWSIGSMASHGCFRMWNKDVETIYPWVKVGTSVTVLGNPFGYRYRGLQEISPSESGPAICYIQNRLSRRGFYKGKADGVFGPATLKALTEFQKANRLKKTDSVNNDIYQALGIK